LATMVETGTLERKKGRNDSFSYELELNKKSKGDWKGRVLYREFSSAHNMSGLQKIFSNISRIHRGENTNHEFEKGTLMGW